MRIVDDPAPVPVETIQPVIVATFEAYVARRLAFYNNPRKVLNALLKKDALLYALRGIRNSDEFVEHAFPAYESSSEETVWGNAWQEAVAKVAPNTVGGGDLRTERDGILWIIQLKMGAQNAGAEAQDIRVLQSKTRNEEREHHPGRKGVKAMYAIVRGSPRDKWKHYRARSAANADIDGFQYQLMVGIPFLEWISAEFDQSGLIRALGHLTEEVPPARSECIVQLKEMLRKRLSAAGLGDDLESVLSLAAGSLRT